MTGGANTNAADVVVIGGGVVGAGTARAIARGGRTVALIEQGSLSEPRGSSRGGTRIIAPAAYPDHSYLEAALRAMEGWRALEAATGASLIDPDGALYVGAAVEDFAESLASARVPHDLLSSREAATRFGVLGLPDDRPVLFQPGAGVIHARKAHGELLSSAVALGARPCENERVVAIDPGSDHVRISTTRGTWECGRVVVVAGPWTSDLLHPLGITLPLTVSSQSVAYFPVEGVTAGMPALMEFDGDEPYSLVDPGRGLKAALHRQGPMVAPDDPWDVVDTEAIELIRAWIASRFGVDAAEFEAEACLYTNTPDERFVLERHDSVVVGSACSGQGFQFAPDTGERLARLAAEG